MLKRPENITQSPGVYLFYNQHQEVIYIGKAKSLAKRIASYFNNPDEHKVSMILQEATNIQTIPVSSEIEALYLEVDLVKKYQPKFNVLLKEGNPFVYLLFSSGTVPTLSVVRTKQKKGTFVGPFLTKKIAHSVFNFLMKTFKLNLCKKKIEHGCLQYHIGICAGFCSKNFDLDFYITRLTIAKNFMTKTPSAVLKDIEQQMILASKNREYEKAKSLLEYKNNFEKLIYTLEKLKTMPSKQAAKSKSQSLPLLIDIKQRLHLQHIPFVIDCFDISHLQGQAIVGSCIRYVHGQPEPKSFRRFEVKTLQGQDDYAALAEIVQRRYKTKTNYPNLIVVDGGKGQISAIKPFIGTAELVGLAKREETIITADFKHFITLDVHRPEDLLLLQIRDKTHHFAISYHRKKRTLIE